MKGFWRAFAWNLIKHSVDYESVDKFYVMGLFKPEGGWKANGFHAFRSKNLLDIVHTKESTMVDFIIEVKQDGLDDNGLVKFTFSIIFIKGVGDVDILFMYTSSEHVRSALNSKYDAFEESIFVERIEELRDYKDEHGHCRVPCKFEQNPSLGNWCSNLRSSYKMMQKGEKPNNKLTQERIDALNDLGFEWNEYKSFVERIEELRDYKLKHGHCRVPCKFEQNPSLGNWCSTLRSSYKMIQEGRKPWIKLTEKNIEELEGLGFEWKYNTNSMKVQVRVQNNRFSQLDDGRDLCAIVPKDIATNSMKVQVRVQNNIFSQLDDGRDLCAIVPKRLHLIRG